MSQSLCLSCGALKVGALNECHVCGAAPFDGESDLVFTDHYLTEKELFHFSSIMHILHEQVEDEEVRTLSFLYYVSRKWPKCGEFDTQKIDSDMMARIDSIYSQYLKALPIQFSDSIQMPVFTKSSWHSAVNDTFQREDIRWQAGISRIVYNGLETAAKIIKLKIAIGEGATLQRIKFSIGQLILRTDWRVYLTPSISLIRDAEEYKRLVIRYRADVKNGWSGRTRRQAEYLGGTHTRLEEMAKLCHELIKHKAGVESITPLEYKRIAQQLNLSYQLYVDLVHVVMNPSLISMK